MTPAYPIISGVQFAPIPGHDGYIAGDDGTIWSCWAERRSVKLDRWRRLTPRIDKKGYERITFGLRSRRQSVPVHSLVLRAFLGDPPPGCEACHGNSVRADNRLVNLRWDTHKANVGDSIKAGTFIFRRGELSGRAKLTENDVRTIRRLRIEGVSQREVANNFGITKTAVRLIEQKKSWSHI